MKDKDKLQPCPCGKVPDELCIEADYGSQWARVGGNCCHEWQIGCHTPNRYDNSNELKKLAIDAWNKAPRKGESIRWDVVSNKVVTSTKENE